MLFNFIRDTIISKNLQGRVIFLFTCPTYICHWIFQIFSLISRQHIHVVVTYIICYTIVKQHMYAICSSDLCFSKNPTIYLYVFVCSTPSGFRVLWFLALFSRGRQLSHNSLRPGQVCPRGVFSGCLALFWAPENEGRSCKNNIHKKKSWKSKKKQNNMEKVKITTPKIRKNAQILRKEFRTSVCALMLRC